jgi:hypothetical protein
VGAIVSGGAVWGVGAIGFGVYCGAKSDSLTRGFANDANAWAGWEDFVSRSPLEPFTENQAREFLTQKGILSEAVISEIWKLSSGGLPLLISMMAASAPTRADAVVDPCESSVERLLKWETDGAKRSMAIDGACARVLNEDVAGAIGDCGFEWLRGCAFVVRDGARWRYHSVVRDQMVRYQWQRSRSRWSLVHGKLAAFYEARRSALGLEVAVADRLMLPIKYAVL